MVGLPKAKRDALRRALNERYSVLLQQLEGKPLSSASDCAGPRKHWTKPEEVVKVDELQLSLAVSDFEAILKEIKKVK